MSKRWNLAKVTLLIVSILICNLTIVWGEAQDPRVERLSEFLAREPKPNVWWLYPLDTEWSKFHFLKIDGKPKKDLVNLLKGSKYSAVAGDYFTLDAPFDYCDKQGQGFLVLVDSRGETVGFQFRAIATDKKALSFVDVQKFVPKEKQFIHKTHSFFPGVVLHSSFRAILLKSREAKVEE